MLGIADSLLKDAEMQKELERQTRSWRASKSGSSGEWMNWSAKRGGKGAAAAEVNACTGRQAESAGNGDAEEKEAQSEAMASESPWLHWVFAGKASMYVSRRGL